jgi:hypothetical protein
MNGLSKCDIYTQWNFTVTMKNEILSLTGKWMELENIILRLKRQKITCSPSYVDYRPKTNAVILLDMGHTVRGEHTWEK